MTDKAKAPPLVSQEWKDAYQLYQVFRPLHYPEKHVELDRFTQNALWNIVCTVLDMLRDLDAAYPEAQRQIAFKVQGKTFTASDLLLLAASILETGSICSNDPNERLKG